MWPLFVSRAQHRFLSGSLSVCELKTANAANRADIVIFCSKCVGILFILRLPEYPMNTLCIRSMECQTFERGIFSVTNQNFPWWRRTLARLNSILGAAVQRVQ